MALVAKIVAVALLVYGVVLGVLWAMQGRLIHLPHVPGRELVATPAERGLSYQAVTIATDDGERLHGWFVPADNARGVLLFFHGNAGNISHRLESIELFNRLGLAVMIVDYRGYGRSTGRPGEAGLYRDARAAWRYLTGSLGIEPRRIVIFGRSLGAAVAARLAAEVSPAALIIESAFTSVADIAARQYPVFPVRMLLQHRYDTEAALAGVESPVMAIHSRDDEIVPLDHGRRLYRNAPRPRQWLELRGGHDGAFYTSRERYLQALDEFVTRYLPETEDAR
ncbi:alpha/beta hydrolase [Arhodomonas sp. AD133]|uniref:alpha/beta hydrolase n=1 Tax=Arhodomonas sp. AD133 TaxID=3415009 RepID=UPI003EBBFF6F